jgi:hypothetical protein
MWLRSWWTHVRVIARPSEVALAQAADERQPVRAERVELSG